MVELSDGVVRLAPPVVAEIPQITRACQDPEVSRWTTIPSPYTTDDGEAFVTTTAADGWRAWADGAEDAKPAWAIHTDDELVGMVGLMLQPVRSGEIGYWTAPWARGRGLMQRAVALVVDWGFDASDGPHLDRIVWHALTGNWASWRIVWKHGFRFEGAERLGGVQRGERRDQWSATLLRDDPRSPVDPWPATTITVPQP
ncbi:MAG: GNAT family N-acetyltransferase [Micrococcales bacterium]|nr:GNAT family N-acetyltransferase [Micrococcales bacterium]